MRTQEAAEPPVRLLALGLLRLFVTVMSALRTRAAMSGRQPSGESMFAAAAVCGLFLGSTNQGGGPLFSGRLRWFVCVTPGERARLL